MQATTQSQYRREEALIDNANSFNILTRSFILYSSFNNNKKKKTKKLKRRVAAVAAAYSIDGDDEISL